MADELDGLFGGERIDAVLVTAPSRTDLQGLPERTVAALARPGDGCLVLTTDAASGLRRATATDADRVGAVDRTRDAPNASPGRLTWRVAGPTNSSRAGTAVDEGLGLLADRGAPRSHLLFDSPAAGRCRRHHAVRPLPRRSRRGAGGRASSRRLRRTDERGPERLKYVVDAHVRVRRREGRQELRCAGIADAPREWVADSDEPGEFGIGVR